MSDNLNSTLIELRGRINGLRDRLLELRRYL